MQYEDIIWKNIFELLQNDGLKFFGINEKIASPVNTELVNVNVHKTLNDKIYLTEKYGKNVRTIVIYMADIQQAEYILRRGSITYEVENFYMFKFDGDSNYEAIKSKLKLKQPA